MLQFQLKDQRRGFKIPCHTVASFWELCPRSLRSIRKHQLVLDSLNSCPSTQISTSSMVSASAASTSEGSFSASGKTIVKLQQHRSHRLFFFTPCAKAETYNTIHDTIHDCSNHSITCFISTLTVSIGKHHGATQETRKDYSQSPAQPLQYGMKKHCMKRQLRCCLSPFCWKRPCLPISAAKYPAFSCKP